MSDESQTDIATPEATHVKERIRQPRQDRSQDTMVRILDAFEMLLRTHSYEAISINDVAKESNTGAGSIYARFRDKRSILLAVTDRIRARARSYFEELYAAAGSDSSQRDALARIMRGNLLWHREHRNLIKASLLMDDADILQTISTAHSSMSNWLSESLCHHMPELTHERAADAASKILRFMMAVFQQMVIFGDIAPTGCVHSDDELIGALVESALAQLSSKRDLGRKHHAQARAL
jgi:AcrR family transcriptional regulator